ncbi:related to cell cycle arrest protein BUB2 [Cephalotrichum gorgonifer]|uniref:Related to cell cycle arrest protein BUB2 n=1 Tax=Cephalotrichum gorgonifer TaxID=2041049 RepID=A0AAE8MS09_9PEZI|nr:related to cell cycle arrest protein BUB2 [Cephalotrichum gorgonifer]
MAGDPYAYGSRPPLPQLAPQLLQPPPSPRTHRTLRRLQSAHTLGSKASNQASLITQQRLREQHLQLQQIQLQPPHQNQSQQATPRNMSPVKRDVSATYAPGVGVTRSSPQRMRERANSDASMGGHAAATAAGAGATAPGGARRSGFKKPSLAHTNLSMQQLIRDGPSDGDFAGALEAARYKILDEGIKSDSDGMSPLRIYVWLILLDAPILSTDDYLSLIHRGASPAYSKIRNDTFRTLTTDPLFRRRVSEASLIRLLNAIAWTLQDARESRRPRSGRSSLAPGAIPTTTEATTTTTTTTPGGSPIAGRTRARALTLTTDGSESGSGSGFGAAAGEPGTYVQGMNVLAAPFLYAARSEAEAFVAFHVLLTRECPGYIRGAMDGVHKGLALVDRVLAIVDPKLSVHLTSRGLKAEIYAFPSVLTLCACTPPLPEVLRLWDFLFAYGPHLNILCIVAQLHLMRDKILKSPSSPNSLLRSFPALQADVIKRVTMTILQKIPRDVYADIVAHAR